MINSKKKIKERRAEYRDILNPITKKILDKGIVIYFKCPNSFTGEDVIELHVSIKNKF
jgi:tRNA modification GTPase